MKEFSGKLTKEDQMAVICILSHGMEGAVYGSDGDIVKTSEIMEALNNDNCEKMAGKPKMIVVQACQGGNI